MNSSFSGSPSCSSLSQSSSETSTAKSAHQALLGIDPPGGLKRKGAAFTVESEDDDDGDDDGGDDDDITQDGIIAGIKHELLSMGNKKKNHKELVEQVLTAIHGKSGESLQHDAVRIFEHSNSSKSAMKQMLTNLFNYHCVLANEARESKPMAKHLQWKDLAQKFTFVLSDEFQQREEIGM